MSGRARIDIPSTAHALMPYRIAAGDELLGYTGVTFPENPRSGCYTYLNRLRATGGLAAPGSRSPWFVDVVDAQGDILDTYELTHDGFEYLRSRLKLQRSHDDYNGQSA